MSLANLKTVLQLEERYRETSERLIELSVPDPNGGPETVSQVYQEYTPLWFYRDPATKGWVPMDMNTNSQLEMSLNQGYKTHSTKYRVFNFEKMTATELTTNQVTQVIHIGEVAEGPSTVDVNSISAWSSSHGMDIATRLAKAVDIRRPEDLRQALASPSTLEGNLALINICVNMLRCVVKGESVRDAIVRGLDGKDDSLTEIECELSVEAYETDTVLSSLRTRKATLEAEFQLKAELEAIPVKPSPSTLSSDSAPLDSFLMKVQHPQDGRTVLLQLFAPWCGSFPYHPHKNVDFTANNLAVSAPAGNVLLTVVPVPNVDAFTIVKSLLMDPPQAMPLYNFQWKANDGGTDGLKGDMKLLGASPHEEVRKWMSQRIERIRRKRNGREEFHLVERLV